VMTSVDITFEQTEPDVVRMVLTHAGFSTQEECDQHQHGWLSCLEKLAALADKQKQLN